MAFTISGTSGLTFPNGSSQTAAAGFSSGTLMLFQQTAAPTGWTKQTTHDNKALRVVSGSASSGGSVGFTTAFASQTPSGSVSINTSGLSAGATTLSTSQIPAHNHTQRGVGNVGSAWTGSDVVTRSTLNTSVNVVTSDTGGGGSHSHSISGSATGSFTGTAIDLAVSYVDLIIASKD